MYEGNTILIPEEATPEATQEAMVICDDCGEEFPESEAVHIDGKIVCPGCVEEYYTLCDNCGCLVCNDYTIYFDGRIYCEECAENELERCDDCDEFFYGGEGYTTHDGRRICECCRDSYSYCSNCDELYPDGDIYWDDDTDEPYCRWCYEERHNKRVIQNYDFKPLPIFYKMDGETTKLYMGVELEIDKGGEDHENAQELMEIVNDWSTKAYCKHDGSIYNGFEIVSHPCTLGYHLNNFRWYELMQKALAMDYRSHETHTCGLHIHISREGLGDTFDEREATIGKILYFIENNWDCVLRFTRRTQGNLERWASRYGLEATPEETYQKAKGDYNRYRCVNLRNAHTIEFRIYRGTLNYNTFAATLQFTHLLCELCKNLTTEEVEEMRWSDLTENIPEEYTALRKYLSIRNLY